MTKKVVNLSVHKNTRQKRANRELAKSFTQDVAHEIKSKNLKTAAFIGVDEDDNWITIFRVGEGMPEMALPGLAQVMLAKAISELNDE